MRHLAVALALLAAACAPRLEPAGPAVAVAELTDPAAIAPDGARLPIKAWLPRGEPKAVVIALHGFNDYGNFFARPGAWLAERGVAAYAYDQRGFGEAPNRGLWAGTETLTADLRTVADLVRRRHPGRPLHLLGESMGGAVVMAALTRPDPPAVDGVVLSAPAVWGREAMPWYQVLALQLSAYTVPWLTVSGRGLNRKPSDNYEMLCALGRDPLVIKDTRIDAVHGLADLMDEALDAAPRLATPALILYGLKDDIIPAEPTRRLLSRLPEGHPHRIALYWEGHHMLLRDLSAEIFWTDILAWMLAPRAPLPSGADDRPWR
ncbi:MAG: lysophospholipase [Magnetospirillum sp. WYHS-4]